MPVHVVKRGSEYCVVDRAGKVAKGGCHPEEQDAEEHARAINANTQKEDVMSDCDGCGSSVAYRDDSVELTVSDRIKNFFADHLSLKADKKCKTIQGKCFPKGDFACNGSENPSEWQLPMTKEPGGAPDIGRLSAAAAAFSEGGHRGNKVKLNEGCSEGAVKAKLRSAYKRIGKEPPESITKEYDPSGFMTFKDMEGTWRWVGIVSNNWQDRHGQWISEKALRYFVDLVDSGQYSKEINKILEDQIFKDTAPNRLQTIVREVAERGTPDLWVWHVPVPIGFAEMVAYDERGFLVATGKQKEGALYTELFEALNKSDDPLGMSHGMPEMLVEFADEEMTTFDKFASLEFTALPLDEAANIGTGFGTMLKELEMQIPDRKRQWFEETLGPEAVAQLDVLLSELHDAAETIGIPTKEATMDEVEMTEETVDEQQVEETVVNAEQHGAEATESTAEVEEEETEAEESFVSDETGEEVNVVLPANMREFALEIQKGMREIVTALRGEIAQVREEVAALQTQVKEAETARQNQIQEAIAQTPMASFGDWMAKSVVGNPAARVDYNEQRKLYTAGPRFSKEDQEAFDDERARQGNPAFSGAPSIIQNLVSKQHGNRTTPLRVGPFANGGQRLSFTQEEGDE